MYDFRILLVFAYLSCVTPLPFQMSVIIFQGFQDIITRLVIWNTVWDIPSCCFHLDANFFLLIRLFFTKDRFNDLGHQLPFCGKLSHLDSLCERRCSFSQLDSCNQTLLLNIIQIRQFHGRTQCHSSLIDHFQQLRLEFC